MRARGLLASLFLVSLAAPADAGVIPADRQVDWTAAGYPGEVPRPATTVNARDFGATGDGTTDDQPAIAAALASLKGAPGVVRLPAGNYRIATGLSLPNGAVLRGDSAAATWIRCDLPNSGSTCIGVSGGTSGTWRAATAGLQKGSTALTLSDATGFAAGDWAEIRETNGTWDTKPADWAVKVVGQILRVVAVDGNVLTLEHPLRTTYDPALSPEVVRVVPRVDAGVEDLGIERVADPTGSGGGHNIQFSYAARCWVKGVEGNKSVGSHVGVYTSTQIDVTGCYFHHAFTYDGSATRGYGVTLNNHSGQVRVENNVFNHLRHAMMVKTGANGNVFAFNYSRDPWRSETINDFSGDISVHGHWPFANLFEGNVVAFVFMDQYWGPAGPHNTFFRNRDEWYGMAVSYDAPSNDQNWVGNEINAGRSNIVLTTLYGLPYAMKGTGHLEFANNDRGTIRPAGTGTLADVSYGRPAGTDFCEVAPGWPSIGVPNGINAGTIRAKQRWDAGGVMTYDALRVEAGPDGAVAVGGSVVLQGDAGGGRGATTLSWSPAEGLDDPHAARPVATPDRSTTYVLTVTDANGCARSDATRVTVTGTVATPVLDPVPGAYGRPVAVTARCDTPWATVRCTTDGSEPDEASPACDGPLALDLPGTWTVRARAFRDDWTPSGEAAGEYALSNEDECALGTDDCDPRAACADAWPGWTCTCPPGWQGDGRTCTDVDECAAGLHDCAPQAECTNTDGGWTCACRPGWLGDGHACMDIDECALGTAGCDDRADCTNTDGAWTCACRAGFEGDGTSGHCTPVCGDGRIVAGEACDDGNRDDGDACGNGCTPNPAGDGCGQAVALEAGVPWEGSLDGTHASGDLAGACAAAGEPAGPDAFAVVAVHAGYVYSATLAPLAGQRLGLALQGSCAADDCDHAATVAGAPGDTVVDEVRPASDGTLVLRVWAPGGQGGAFVLEVDERAPPADEAGDDAAGATDAGTDAAEVAEDVAEDAGVDAIPDVAADGNGDVAAEAFEDAEPDVAADVALPDAATDVDAAPDGSPDAVPDAVDDVPADGVSTEPSPTDLAAADVPADGVPGPDAESPDRPGADVPAADLPAGDGPSDDLPPVARKGGGCGQASAPAGATPLLVLLWLAIGRRRATGARPG